MTAIIPKRKWKLLANLNLESWLGLGGKI